MTKLACGDSHEEDKEDEKQLLKVGTKERKYEGSINKDNHIEDIEQRSDLMLLKFWEELKFLEDWLINSKTEEDCIAIVDKKHRKEEMLTTSKYVEESFQADYVIVVTKGDDDKKIPTHGIMDDSFMPKKGNAKFVEEMKLLEGWLAKDKVDKYYTKFAKLVQIDSEKHVRMKNNSGMIKELGEERIALKDNNEVEDAKHDKKVAKFQRRNYL